MIIDNGIKFNAKPVILQISITLNLSIKICYRSNFQQNFSTIIALNNKKTELKI